MSATAVRRSRSRIMRGGVRSALHGGLRHTGQRFSLLVENRCGVTGDEHLRMTGNRQVRLYQRAARAIEWNTKRRHQRRGSDTGCPQDGASVEPFRAQPYAAGVDRRHRHALADLDAQPRQRGARRTAQLLGKRRKNRRPGLDQHDAGARRVDGPELVAQRLPRDFRQRAGQLDAGRVRHRRARTSAAPAA